MAALSRLRKRNASRAKSTIPFFLRKRSSTAWRRAASGADQRDHVVSYEKPFVKFERLLETYIVFSPRGFQSFRMAMPLWLKEKLFQKRLLAESLGEIDGTIQRIGSPVSIRQWIGAGRWRC